MGLNIVEKSRERYLEHKKRHQEILDVAIQLFNAKGYAGATTAELAQKAGVSEPTIYTHFDNKKGVFLECVRSIIAQLLMAYREVYRKNLDDELGYLKGVTKVYVDFVVQNPHKSMFVVHLLSYKDDPEFDDILNGFMEKNIEGVKRILESAKKKGKLKTKIDAHFLATAFVGQYLTVVAMREFVGPTYFTDETFFEMMQNMLGIH